MNSKAASFRDTSCAIVLFGILLVAISWFLLFLKIEAERKVEIDHSVKLVTNFARAFQEHSLRTLNSADQVALFIKYQYERGGRLDLSSYTVGDVLAADPYVLVSITDENGQLLTSNQTPFVSSNISDREHFTVHKNADSGKAFISKPVLGRSSGKWSIQMTRRLNNPDGSFGGVVVISLDPFYFTDFYNQVNLGGDSSIGLVGYDGVVRCWLSKERLCVGMDLSSTGSRLMKELPARSSGQYEAVSPIDGAKRFYAYQSLPNYPLAVVVGLSEADILQEFYARQGLYCLAVGLLDLFIIGFCVALVRMKRMEQEFGRLERLNLIGEMAAGLGHEIRNPLTTVRGFLRVLAAKPAYRQEKEHFDLMVEELDRANDTITEYLALSKDKTAKRTVMKLNELIARLFPLIKADATMQDKEIVLKTEEIPELLLDEKQIRQLILNLVRNGLEAMSPGGKITISTFIDGQEAVMAIQDEGKGIDNHLLARIGTPFFTTKESGTGLGMAVCNSIVARHNARMKLETSPAGTTITIRFATVGNERQET